MTASESNRSPAPGVSQRPAAAALARTMLSIMLIAAVCVWATLLVGTRSINVGADTDAYARFFRSFGGGEVETRIEPGFVLLTRAVSELGLSLTGYQSVLFVILLLTVLFATREYFHYLGRERGYLAFLTASLMLLFLSPVFVSASINGIRQGLSALLVFTALLSFHQRQWWQFVIYGILAASLHYSSLAYLFFAPMLLLKKRALWAVLVLAFSLYCSGLSMSLTKIIAPTIYAFVMKYGASADYDAGVRIDFAVFSIVWFLLPYFASRIAYSPYSERIKSSASVYLVMLLPFFAVGWGNYSNRYLFSAWLAVSLMIAAILCHSRIALLRSRLALSFGLVAASAVYYTHINGIYLAQI